MWGFNLPPSPIISHKTVMMYPPNIINSFLPNVHIWHYVKGVRIWSFSGPYFPAFGVNIQSECGNIRTRKIPKKDTFQAVWSLLKISKNQYNKAV